MRVQTEALSTTTPQESQSDTGWPKWKKNWWHCCKSVSLQRRILVSLYHKQWEQLEFGAFSRPHMVWRLAVDAVVKCVKKSWSQSPSVTSESFQNWSRLGKSCCVPPAWGVKKPFIVQYVMPPLLLLPTPWTTQNHLVLLLTKRDATVSVIIQMYGFIFFCREICKCQNTDSVRRFCVWMHFPQLPILTWLLTLQLPPPQFNCFGKYDYSTPSPTKKNKKQKKNMTTSSHKDLYIQGACAAFQHFSNTCQKATRQDVARKQPGTDLTVSLTNPLDRWPPSAKWRRFWTSSPPELLT